MSASKGLVLVTGGRRGIGRAIVERFKEAGFCVAACGLSPELNSAADLYSQCDVTNRSEVDRWVLDVSERFGKIAVLVNNAGAGGANACEGKAGDSQWHNMIATNLTSAYLVSSAVIPYLTAPAAIVNVASVLGHRGEADQTAYCAAKHGLIGFTKALAKALAGRSVTVNAVSPGWVDTDLAASRFHELGISRAVAASHSAANRIFTPAEVADTVFFLSSPGARGISGQSLILDGGGV